MIRNFQKSEAIKTVNNEHGGLKTESLVKLSLIFVISLLAFSVGTYVGKQFSDSQYKMASLEKEYKERSTASDGIPEYEDEGEEGLAEDNDENSEDALTDEDIASLTEEFVETEKRQLAKTAVETNEAPAQGEDFTRKAMDSEVSNEAIRVAQEKAPTVDVKKVAKPRVPSSLPKMVSSTSIGKYTIQVASYAAEPEAKQHVQKLQNLGFNSFYLEATIKGRPWYRVSIGLYGSYREAQSNRKDIMKRAGLSSALVQKIVK